MASHQGWSGQSWVFLSISAAAFAFGVAACGDDSGGGGTGNGSTGANGNGANGTGNDSTGATGAGANGTGASGNGGDGTGAGSTGGGGSCTPDCTNKQCGPDGCGDICGTCSNGDACNANGQCEVFCGNSCGAGCGPCPSNSSQTLTCTPAGLCKCNASCTPDCNGKNCGDDGCGGSCGSCGAGSVCTFDPNLGTPWQCAAYAGPSPNTSFFVTSRGTGAQGANYGGLAGADSFCTQLAEEAGITGKTWRAFLSAGSTAARDRIGTGPWFNVAGTPVVDPNCGGGCVDALLANGVPAEDTLTEKGTQLDWANAHDIFTGSDSSGNPTGSDCQGWTSNNELDSGTVGHSNEAFSWISAHTTGCDQVGMQCTAGQGMLYCFAL